jgi:creatinine amidohydrolase
MEKIFKFAALMFIGVLVLAAFRGPEPRQEITTVTSGGTSIFHETMVDMTWPEVEKAAKRGAVVLMTTAVVEEHGPHMSCGIDTYLGYLMCKLTRRELESRGINAVIAPPFYWGINRTSHVFPGTFTVRTETMKALIHDMLASLKGMGFQNIYSINAHGDGLHIRTAIEAIVEAQKSLGLNVRYLMSEEDAKRAGLTGNEPFFLIHKSPPAEAGPKDYLDLHAGAWETGAVAAFFPEQVNIKAARALQPTKVTLSELSEWVKDMKKVTPLGYLGDPAGFDLPKAKKNVEDNCRMMADAIAAVLGKGNNKSD